MVKIVIVLGSLIAAGGLAWAAMIFMEEAPEPAPTRPAPTKKARPVKKAPRKTAEKPAASVPLKTPAQPSQPAQPRDLAAGLGGLAGNIRVAQSLESYGLDLEIVAQKTDAGGTRRGGRLRRVRPNENGDFEARALGPGEWQVVARLEGTEVARFDGLVVDAGSVARPEDLAEIVVGDSFVMGEVVVRDAEGALAHGARVTFSVETPGQQPASPEEGRGGRRGRGRNRGGRRGNRGASESTDAEGKVLRLIDAAQSVTVRVAHAGHATAEFPDARFPLDVHLTKRTAADGAGDGNRGGRRGRGRRGRGMNGEGRAQLLQEFDADGDGELSLEERAKARDAMRARRQARRGEGGGDGGENGGRRRRER